MFAEAVSSIVAVDTRCTIVSDMTCHETLIPLTVTGRANINIEDCDIRRVTVRTDKRFFLSLELVRG